MNRDPSPAIGLHNVYSADELIETTNLTLDACISQIKERSEKAWADWHEKFGNAAPWAQDTSRTSDFCYGLAEAIEIIEKVKREGP
jgi:hypothetical protein